MRSPSEISKAGTFLLPRKWTTWDPGTSKTGPAQETNVGLKCQHWEDSLTGSLRPGESFHWTNSAETPHSKLSRRIPSGNWYSGGVQDKQLTSISKGWGGLTVSSSGVCSRTFLVYPHSYAQPSSSPYSLITCFSNVWDSNPSFKRTSVCILLEKQK